MNIKADVPSMLVHSLQKGMSVPVRIGNINPTVAKITQIYPVADPSRHTVVVKFDLPVGVLASPGMYAEIYLPDSTPGGNTVVTIPKTALIQGRSLPTVLVADESAKSSSLRLIRLGTEQGDGSGKSVTDSFRTQGFSQLVVGQSISCHAITECHSGLPCS